MAKTVKVLSIISTCFCGIYAVGSLILAGLFAVLINEIGGSMSVLGGIFSAIFYLAAGFMVAAFIVYLIPFIMGIIAVVRYSKTQSVDTFKAEAIVKIVFGSIGTVAGVAMLAISEFALAIFLVVAIACSVVVLSVVELAKIAQEKKNVLAAQYGDNYQQI